MGILHTMTVREQHEVERKLASYRDVCIPIHGFDRHIISSEFARGSKVIRLGVKHDDVAIRDMSKS